MACFPPLFPRTLDIMLKNNRLPSLPPSTSARFLRVSILLYIGVLISSLYFTTVDYCVFPLLSLETGVLVGTIGLLIGIEYWSISRFGYTMTRKTAVTLLIVRMVLFEVVSIFDCSDFSFFVYLIIPFTAYFCMGRHVSYGLSVLYLGIFVAKHITRCIECGLVEAVSDTLIFAIGLVFSLSMATVVSEEEVSRAKAEMLLLDLEASHRQLQAYAIQVAELAATEERNRLARDIHDSLGHYLTVINIQLEKAVAFRQRDAVVAEQAVLHAKRTASEALRDVRQSVSALREPVERFSLSTALNNLVNRMNNDHLHIDLTIEGTEDAYSPPVLMALYRVAQEGLTNVHKHAQAQHAEVRLQFESDAVHLHIEDDGQGFETTTVLPTLAADRNGRFGLQGVQERLELVGGTLSLRSQPDQGTHLAVHIPQGSLAFNG